MEDVSGGNSASASPDAGTASPAVQSGSVAGSAAPAGQETPASGITDSTEREGFIPRARFDEVNTRMSAAEKALADYRQQHGWAEAVERQQLEETMQWYARYKGDPGEFLEQAYQEALSHPVHGATVKSRIGKMLAALRQQQQQPERIEPGIPVMNERGEIVAKTYTDAQLEQLLQQKLDAALNPFKEDLETRKSQAEREQQQRRAHEQADADVAYVKKLPGFEEHKADILAVFKANPRMTIRQAYDEILTTKIFPTIGQKSEQKVLSDLHNKANAQTVSQGAAVGQRPPQFKKFSEAHAYYEKHPEEAAAMANRK